MKKLIFITLVFILSGCKTTYHYDMGMTSQQFEREFRGAKIVEQTITTAIYWHPDTQKYWYFQNDQLVRIDKGIRKSDITIDVNNK